jgi:hypothetical protein
MKKFVQEYGRLVVTIVALTGFFVLLGVLLSQNVSNTKSIYGIFNRNSQDSSAVYNDDFYDSVINDTVESSMAPYFEIADDADYSISENQIDWNRLFKDVKIIYVGKDVTNVNSVNGDRESSSCLRIQTKHYTSNRH